MNLATFTKTSAAQLGFSHCGWVALDRHDTDDSFTTWIANNYHGEMEYLASSATTRSDPRTILPSAQSAIVLSHNYYPAKIENPHISCYAQGRDYHRYLRKKLKKLGETINDQFVCEAEFRPCVDSAPLMERQLAQRAGLGWLGKNSMLITPTGSYFFLAVLLSSLPAPDTTPPTLSERCGSCRACIDSCPSAAIVDNGVIDARRCLSYLTIEYKGTIPVELRSAMGTTIFGCDICQRCCPWNSKQPVSSDTAFATNASLTNVGLLEMLSWERELFEKQSEGSPLRRMGFECFRRNLAVAIGNSGNGNASGDNSSAAIAALNEARGVSAMVDEHIDWALAQLTR